MNPTSESTREHRRRPPLRRKRLIDLSIFFFYIGWSLLITRPWISHPMTTSIGAYDPVFKIESVDTLSNLTFGGWWRFAIIDLGIWPLSPTTYLMYPYGASHGVSFDSVLMAVQIGILDIFLPLFLGYNIVLLLSIVLCGFVSYRYFKKLFGRGWLAFALGLTAESMPFLLQRALGHTNLMPVWTLAAAMHLYHHFSVRPTLKRNIAWGLSFPLLALASWYILILGMVFHFCAGAGEMIAARKLNISERYSLFGKLLFGWAVGLSLVFLIAYPMLDGAKARNKPKVEDLAEFSTPLLQYILPFPGSYLHRIPFVSSMQSDLMTAWEALAGVPILCLFLLLIYFIMPRVAGNRWMLLLASLAALLLSLGPYLQLDGREEQGLKLPLYYMLKISDLFAVFRAPGRAHVLLFFIALTGTGYVLHFFYQKWKPWRWFALCWPFIMIFFAGANIAWSIPLGPWPAFPNPAIPVFYSDLRQKGGRGAILDVPFDYFFSPRYNLYQLEHRRPIVNSTLYHDAHRWEFVRWTQERTPLLFFTFNNSAAANQANVQRILDPGFMQDLAKYKIEYFIIHEGYLRQITEGNLAHPETRRYYNQIEEAWKDRLVHSDDLIRVYRTESPATFHQ